VIRTPSTLDETGLCDWAEVSAIASARRSATQGDLIKLIRFDDSQEDDLFADPHEATNDELIADSVLSIASSRSLLLGKQYPFIVDRGIRFDPKRLTGGRAYLFHLLMSSLDHEHIPELARHLFEVEATEALRSYFGGESFHFGWTTLNANRGKIQKRIEEFCSTTSLGWKAANPVRVPPQSNDIEIDSIVWRQPFDKRKNALVILGQCATGTNWRSKLVTASTRLLEDCLDGSKDGPWVTSFCTPFQIPQKDWYNTARKHDGMLWDRLRLVLVTTAGSASKRGQLHDPKSVEWLELTLKRLAEANAEAERRPPRTKKRQARRHA